MKEIEAKGFVKSVKPKQGRGNTIEVVIEMGYEAKLLTDIAECMMTSEDLAKVSISYSVAELFDEEEG